VMIYVSCQLSTRSIDHGVDEHIPWATLLDR
jgi:hypothetical protein